MLTIVAGPLKSEAGTILNLIKLIISATHIFDDTEVDNILRTRFNDIKLTAPEELETFFYCLIKNRPNLARRLCHDMPFKK